MLILTGGEDVVEDVGRRQTGGKRGFEHRKQSVVLGVVRNDAGERRVRLIEENDGRNELSVMLVVEHDDGKRFGMEREGVGV